MDRAQTQPRVDIGIITIREDEFRAVLDAFSDALRPIHSRCNYELRSVKRNDGQHYVVAVARSAEQGNVAAQALANAMLDELAPRWLLVVGIAGAPSGSDATLGDVVVSTRIVDFTVGAALPDGAFEFAHGGGPILHEAMKIVANLPARDDDLGAWGATISSLRPPGNGSPPRVVTGAILSSDLLMRDPERLRVQLGAARQALAVEMESAGIYRATHDRHVPFLAIRGISDIVGIPRDRAWTSYAAASAAAFTQAFLRLGVIPIDLDEKRDLEVQDLVLATNVFIVYAAQESGFASELGTILAPQCRGGVIHVPLGPGIHLGQPLRTDLAAAKVVVVLLSKDVLELKHFCDNELDAVAHRSAFGQARMYLVLAHSCDWKTEPFLYKRLFWDNDIPICQLPHRDEAWLELARSLVESAQEIDQYAALMHERHRRFSRAPKATQGLAFVRVCVDPTDELWREETSPSLPYPSPFTAEPGQYVFLNGLIFAEKGGIALNLDITLMNQSASSIILTKVGIEIIAVAHIPQCYGDFTPIKIRKMDSYTLQLPDVRKMLEDQFSKCDRWDAQGPIELDVPVSISIPDPILIPTMTPYRFGLQLADFTMKMPNNSLIRVWIDTNVGVAASTSLIVFTS